MCFGNRRTRWVTLWISTVHCWQAMFTYINKTKVNM